MHKAEADFKGFHIASLESRRADDMARLISRSGGVAHVSPSMREVPIEPNRGAIDFAYRLMTGHISIVILMTGVGFRYLLRAIERHLDQQRFLDSLSDVVTICRGPKPAAAMREVGLTPTYRVPEPNTWREMLQTIDANVSIANQIVGVQEYGVTNASLVAGLEARGATVEPVRVYGWEFPEETGPLEENVRALAAGERDMLLLTSAHQVVNMLRMAETLDIVDQLRDGLYRTVIASIGPTTTQMLEECDIHVDMEPGHPKMGHLVTESAQKGVALIEAKKRLQVSSPPAEQSSHGSPVLRKPVHASLSRRIDRADAGVVDASGWPVHG